MGSAMLCSTDDIHNRALSNVLTLGDIHRLVSSHRLMMYACSVFWLELSRRSASAAEDCFFATAMATYFFATACPAAEDCSTQAWRRSQCWGYSYDECKHQVVRHLMASGKHSMSKGDACALADLCRIEEGVYEKDEPPAKRQKGGPAEQKQGPSDDLTEQLMQQQEVLMQQLQQQQHQLQQQAAIDASQRPLGVGARATIGSTSLSVVPAKSSGYVHMRVHDFQASIDCVTRAVSSAQQAQRLAAAAARAFGDEVVALNEVKANLEVLKVGMQ